MKIIASHNGRLATQRAWDELQAGAAPLDACVQGVTLVEDDPDELTVGYGGLPNEDGVVELDAAVMDGATHRAGSVVGLRDIRHVSKVAQCVMQQTRRVMLAGQGARQFALANGFPVEDLLTDRAREMWLYWKRTRSEHDDWRDPEADEALDVRAWFEKHFYKQRSDLAGTVHCAAVDASSDLACVTSTSGHAFKMAGRVGDSPVIGAGLYVDNQVGSCGSIGHGEANLRCLTSFFAVQKMREGLSPQDAGLAALEEVVQRTLPEEQDAAGRPTFNLQVFLLHKDGRHAGAAIWGGKQLAITDSEGTRLEDCVALY